MKVIHKLFCSKKIKQLEDENESLKQKISEKQDVINQTNAYWKKKFYALKNKQK